MDNKARLMLMYRRKLAVIKDLIKVTEESKSPERKRAALLAYLNREKKILLKDICTITLLEVAS